MKGTAAAIAASLLLAGCAIEGAREAPAAQALGPAVDCVPLQQIAHTRVHSDRLVDFHMTGGRVFRNRLPHACPGLGFAQSFSYRPAADRLCSVDTIRVHHPQTMGSTCGLGRFEPVALAPR